MKENQTSQKTSTEWDHNLHCTFSILILPDTVGSLWQFEVQDRFYFKKFQNHSTHFIQTLEYTRYHYRKKPGTILTWTIHAS